MPGLATLVLIVQELSQVVAALFDFCVFFLSGCMCHGFS